MYGLNHQFDRTLIENSNQWAGTPNCQVGLGLVGGSKSNDILGWAYLVLMGQIASMNPAHLLIWPKMSGLAQPESKIGSTFGFGWRVSSGIAPLQWPPKRSSSSGVPCAYLLIWNPPLCFLLEHPSPDVDGAVDVDIIAKFSEFHFPLLFVN